VSACSPRIIKENYLYLSLKTRTGGYDWVAHEQEFLEAVRKTANDEESAKAIYRMVRLLKNGHTDLSTGVRTDRGHPQAGDLGQQGGQPARLRSQG
jgi:hypothetical protein